MCTVIPKRRLCSDDLAVLSGRRFVPCEPDDDQPRHALAIDEFLPGEAFGFGPVTISQLVRSMDIRDVPGVT